MEKVDALIGRILLSAIFLLAGINKVFDFAGALEQMRSHGMPLPNLFLVAAILFEIGGGLSITVGYKARFGAMALIVFLIPATVIFHANFVDPNQMAHFLKNLSILGGLILVVSHGPGPMSLDAGSSD